MIETEQSIVIAAPIDAVWAHARDIEGWARLMPGLQDCAVLNETDSRWTLKVGVGALVRTVRVSVHVDRWAGPGEVDFTYRLEGDPVKGGGRYRARSIGPNETGMTLAVHVAGEGPMAPMWEAMGKPLLPKFAGAFADQFKAEVEATHAAAPVPPATPGPPAPPLARLLAWLRGLLRPAAPTSEKA